MSAFDLETSLKNAERRLGKAPRSGGRRPRSDRGVSRLDPRVLAWVEEELSGYDRPPMAGVIVRVTGRCREERLRPPSRATVYKLLATAATGTYRVAELPPAVRDALYNLGSAGEVPGHQLAFYCFNYGSLAAVSFASGLPWLALHRALQLPGYRAKSRGLIEAVARVRGI
jgi:hypothetical protein